MEMNLEADLGFDEPNSADSGFWDHGCSHYRRRCKIRAPCCNEIFACRHCHNEAKNGLETRPLDRHDLPRHNVTKVICSLCNTEQDVQQNCTNCGVCMGKYFCSICKFFDDDVSKRQFHCEDCGICRVGGEENYFHCQKCGCCYVKQMEDGHPCVESSMHHNCPVCLEFLFESTKEINVLPCGHTIHLECRQEMRRNYWYTCPICCKSLCDMTKLWKNLDHQIAATPMPEMYQNKLVWILCNDCGENSEVQFHKIAHKCLSCESYNTRQIKGRPSDGMT